MWDAYGGKIRLHSIINDYMRRCLSVHCVMRIAAIQVIEQLTEVVLLNSIPEYIRSENDPNFTEKVLLSG